MLSIVVKKGCVPPTNCRGNARLCELRLGLRGRRVTTPLALDGAEPQLDASGVEPLLNWRALFGRHVSCSKYPC